MGWKGTVRSLQAAARQAQREAERRQREQARRQRELAKLAELDRAELEVEIFDDYIGQLESMHAVEVAEVDWHEMANGSPPESPVLSDRHRVAALAALNEFKPRRFESKRKQFARRAELEEAVKEAILADEQEYELAQADHRSELAEWERSSVLARRVLAGERGALAQAAAEIQDLGESDFFRFVNIDAREDSCPTVEVGVRPIDDIVPPEQKSLLQSGKLSVKQMPKGRYHALYQDYVCGSALLMANAVLGLLPVNSLMVNATASMLNTTTGHIEETPILSMYVPRETIARLNLARVDASDALANFNHNMKFLKTKGFQPIEPISPPG